MSKCIERPLIGDIYLMRFDGRSSEQHGWRPGLVFQNNVGNRHSPNVIALPLTTSIKKMGMPTHVLLPAKDTGLRMDSVVLCENPERISKDRIGKYVTTLPIEYMREVVSANLLASSGIACLDPDVLLSIWQRAVLLNGDIHKEA